MPLTLQLYGTDPEKSGHIIIDKNFLIITYFQDGTKESRDKAHENRMRILTLLRNIRDLQNIRSNEEDFAMTEDPRHNALEHVGPYDRHECYHAHLMLKETVGFTQVNFILSNLALAGYEDLISEPCRELMLKTAEGYFKDLKYSKAAFKIEADYQEEKENEYRSAGVNVFEKNDPNIDERLKIYDFDMSQYNDFNFPLLMLSNTLNAVKTSISNTIKFFSSAFTYYPPKQADSTFQQKIEHIASVKR